MYRVIWLRPETHTTSKRKHNAHTRWISNKTVTPNNCCVFGWDFIGSQALSLSRNQNEKLPLAAVFSVPISLALSLPVSLSLSLVQLHMSNFTPAIYSNNSSLTITKMYFILFNSELCVRRAFVCACGFVNVLDAGCCLILRRERIGLQMYVCWQIQWSQCVIVSKYKCKQPSFTIYWARETDRKKRRLQAPIPAHLKRNTSSTRYKRK